MAKNREAPDVDPYSVDISVLADDALRGRVDEYNRRYLHWSEVSYRTSTDEEFERVWGAMRLVRELSSVKLEVCGIQYSFCMNPRFTELLHFIDREAADGLEGRMPDGKVRRARLRESLFEESIESSLIEGASTTRRVAIGMLRSKRKPETSDERMIVNNHLAMEEIGQRLDEDLTPELILDIHRIITAGTMRYGPEWEGRFRESDDIVVGDPLDEERVYHTPPGHELIPDMIRGLCDFANGTDGPYVHPVIKAVILHYMIGYIHPFMDGNGRLARSLFYWYCIKNGYRVLRYTSISAVIGRSRGRYGRAYQFTESDGSDLTYFIGYNLECIRESIEETEERLLEMEKRRMSTTGLTSVGTLDRLEATLLDDRLKEGGTFSIYDVQSAYGISYETARSHVMRLQDLDLVTVAAKEGKKRLYAVNEERVRELMGDRT